MNQQPDGNGQQGTGGIGTGQATSTPNQQGSQPHLGSQPDTHSAPGGTGQSGSDSSEATATADRAGATDRDIGAKTPGDPGDLLSQPQGDGNYVKHGDQQMPLAGAPDVPGGTD